MLCAIQSRREKLTIWRKGKVVGRGKVAFKFSEFRSKKLMFLCMKTYIFAHMSIKLCENTKNYKSGDCEQESEEKNSKFRFLNVQN